MVTVAMVDLKSRRYWREGCPEEAMAAASSILQTLNFDFGCRMVIVAMVDLKSQRCWRAGYLELLFLQLGNYCHCSMEGTTMVVAAAVMIVQYWKSFAQSFVWRVNFV